MAGGRRGGDRARRGGARRLLSLKGTLWQFKRTIPGDLRAHYDGKSAVVQSTGTSDLRAAQRVRDALEAQTTEDFETLRRGGTVAGGSGQKDPAELGRIMREELARAEREGGPRKALEVSFSVDATVDSFKSEAQRTAYLKALHGHEAVNAFMDDYATYRSDLREKTVEERRGLIRQFAEWSAKDDLALPEVNRRVAGRYVSEKLDGMHPATARKHLTALTDYWAFLLARGHVTPPPGEDGNPWTGQIAQRGRSAGRRRRGRESDPEERAFTDQEVRALLYGPAKDTFNAAYVADLLDVLRISLLSGLRLDEVVSLTAGDAKDGSIRVVAGKTDAAARTVPMHPDLQPIFARRAPEGRPAATPVFPDLHKLPRPGDTFGKRFRRYREAAGVQDDREGVRRSLVNFHSARRWFAQQARHNGHPLETIKEVMGHVADRRDRVTLGYTGAASEAQRKALVESLRLPREGEGGE